MDIYWMDLFSVIFLGCATIFIIFTTIRQSWKAGRNYAQIHGVTLNRFHQWAYKLPKYNKKL